MSDDESVRVDEGARVGPSASAAEDDDELYEHEDEQDAPPGALETEEGEEEEHEEEEEDYIQDDDEGSEHSEQSDKRQRVDSGEASRIAELELENQNLRTELAALRNEVLPKMLAIKTGQDALVRVFGAYSSAPAGGLLPTEAVAQASDVKKSVKLVQIFGVGQDEIMLHSAIDEIHAPVRFAASGSFPHAIAIDSRTQQRQYQVESRRPTCLRFRLVSKLDGRRANETDLCADGMLPFRMSMRFADNQQEVTEDDFQRLNGGTTFTKPPLKRICVMQMSNGEVVYNITRWDCTSNDSAPKSRPFVICVYPDHPDFADNPDLKVTTPPFQIRSKIVTAK